MKILFFTLIFIIGTLFGSFATLAIHRLPQKKDIIKKRSYCPKCNHELGFFDLIPVLSYIFLGGKCRYCKKSISPKYFFIEIISGLCAVLIFIRLQVSPIDVNLSIMLDFLYFVIYATTIIIVALIDKDKKIIYRKVLLVRNNYMSTLYVISMLNK